VGLIDSDTYKHYRYETARGHCHLIKLIPDISINLPVFYYEYSSLVGQTTIYSVVDIEQGSSVRSACLQF